MIIEAEGKTYHVGATDLHVRSEPSLNGQILGKLQAGDQVQVFDEAYGWYKTFYNGKEAWIASQFLMVEEQERAATNDSLNDVSITATGVRIRSGPGTNYPIIGFTTIGESFSVVDTEDQWIKVDLKNGKIGWIAGWLTNPQSTTYIPEEPSAQATSDTEQSVEQTATTTTVSNEQNLNGFNIVLDPGHGGMDPGAIGLGGIFEKDVIMEVLSEIASELRQAGATVLLTRSNDSYVDHATRLRISHAYQTHAFISLHFNASPIVSANGISTHYFGPDSKELAYEMQSSLSKHVTMRDRGVRSSNFYVLRNNQNKALLLEMGFITNPHDLLTIRTSDYQDNLAEGITKGLLAYFK